MVTNGVGLLAVATSSSLGFGVGRKLKQALERGPQGDCRAHRWSQLPVSPRNQINTQDATVNLDDSLDDALSMRLAYTVIHQSNIALVPVTAWRRG